MTEMEDYFTQIYDGKIVACKKMRKISEILLDQLYMPNEYHFDYDIAKRHTEFIERFCYVPAGNIGERIKLELFQKARLQALFGFVDDNDKRQYNECLIIEGRKNGKTTECATVENDLLINDDEGAPEIYNVATKKDQANKGYTAVLNMRKQSKLLSKYTRKRAGDLYCEMNMGFIKPLASDTGTLDSLDAHCVIIDELAAIKNRDLYDLMKQSMGAREQPILFCITTNGFVREGIFDAQYEYASKVLSGEVVDKRFLPFIYELDDINEWEKEECWIKANPGLGTIKKVSFLREMVHKAQNDPSFKPTVLVKDFNMKQNSATAWLSWETLYNDELIPEHRFKYCIGGFDAADSVDLNSARVLMMRKNDSKIYTRQMYWIPEEAIEKYEKKGNRVGRDKVPYREWIDAGLMRTVPGNKVDKRVILEWFKELRDVDKLYVQYIGYDPWHIDDSLLREFKSEFGPNCMIPVRQGVATLSDPMKNLAADLEKNLIVYNNNPIDQWCLYNTEVKTDVNANIQPVKKTDQTQRIDGAMSLIDAYIALMNKMDEFITIVK